MGVSRYGDLVRFAERQVRPNIQIRRAKTLGASDLKIAAPIPTEELPGRSKQGKGSAGLSVW